MTMEMRNWQYNQRASVQRTDAEWRARFPHVRTEIYEFDLDDHAIYVPPDQIVLSRVEADFNRNVRMAADRVRLVDKRPEDAARIPSLTDRDWARGFGGLPMTTHDMRLLLAAKIRAAPLLANSKPSGEGHLELSFEGALTEDQEKRILDTVRPHAKGMEPRVVERRALASRAPRERADVLHFQPVRQRQKVPNFVSEEEEWWFEKVPDVYARNVSSRSFNFENDAGMACYVQGSMENVDIRQLLLSFDTIYLSPPIESGPNSSFWASQIITTEDLLTLVGQDRVRLIHSQPEERGDLGLLREAHSLNPRGVLGRRRSAGLIAAHLVEMDDWFLLSDSAFASEMPQMIERVASRFGISNELAAATLLYPTVARRQSFSAFTNSGLMGLARFGQGKLFADYYRKFKDKDVTLEASILGSELEIARLLDATYILPTGANYIHSWKILLQLMGDRVNLYRHLRQGVAASWAVHQRGEREASRSLLPPVPLVEFSKHATIAQVLDVSGRKSDRRKGRALLSRLADLSQDERPAEVERIERELYEHEITRQKHSSTRRVIDLAANAGSAFGVPLASFLNAWDLANTFLELARQVPALDRVVDTMENAIANENRGLNEYVSFLSKLSPVAWLRSASDEQSDRFI